MREVRPLKYKELDGLSEKQLKEHHDVLYAGYVKKIDEIEEKLKKIDLASAGAVYSDLRELKLEETFALNGAKLHEGYFDNMIKGGNEPAGKILEMIERDFGSYENWEKEFKALGLAARGWVVLGYDLDEKKLKNILCDSHNQGGVWNMISLFIMDVYEHAYFIDYAAGRKAYIEAFFKNIDWRSIDKLMSRFGIYFLEG
ncbi:superoxide dismutase [Candidatus Giovannonibacteria bacterium RIFCSPHIGHO2_01_FULL_48_47]|nr:MAG: superoxide dismutase [Candidatus Giovannonibacteria bacterium RIFCSPHIGHO2_01_FULL_48_47]OGF67639.1 MAG: superoxide dismutase [Candidatus Giovannonibacteria bacterium RIFCSPHIGHO2_02_FULL_48_15]OGF89803.1 MAG: superoxide dismutase [Candidatus Giovannonibacteria bacterium RIFCSPLOWO2_01_FULL_48_47]OGF95413.1 MAG: superoxide dismutase [Candidatus Giovannonibacteria bacterium RIFOXYC1_FULL_48_8]OGF95960.1 MAG: superoxide dismutase [Candidatus Giovannonibacteria bacterium RIFOXYD1_FULL_48_2